MHRVRSQEAATSVPSASQHGGTPSRPQDEASDSSVLTSPEAQKKRDGNSSESHVVPCPPARSLAGLLSQGVPPAVSAAEQGLGRWSAMKLEQGRRFQSPRGSPDVG